MAKAIRADTEKFIMAAVSHVGRECLIWPFYRDAYGYGRSTHPEIKTRLAHRIVCTLAHGEAPHGKRFVRHLCGNGHNGCVNPNHLAWGTAKENSDDKSRHGNMPHGETSGASKLTDRSVAQILAMRDMGATYRNLAEIFSVTNGTVQAICERRTWRHVNASQAARDIHLVVQ